MTRFRLQMAPIVALAAFTFGIHGFGQDLFEQQKTTREDAPLTEEQKAAGEKESIF